jgi:uncharacterized protein with GYD domain
MKKYLIKASYNSTGVKGLLQDGGSRRRSEVQKMIEGLGGRLESFYFAFGEHDAYVTVELQDDITAAAAVSKVNASGVVSVTTTVLLTPEDVDTALKKAVSYKAPGDK